MHGYAANSLRLFPCASGAGIRTAEPPVFGLYLKFFICEMPVCGKKERKKISPSAFFFFCHVPFRSRSGAQASPLIYRNYRQIMTMLKQQNIMQHTGSIKCRIIGEEEKPSRKNKLGRISARVWKFNSMLFFHDSRQVSPRIWLL